MYLTLKTRKVKLNYLMRTLSIHPRAYHLIPNRLTTQVPAMQSIIRKLRHEWSLDEETIRAKLLKYYLAKWTGRHLAEQLAVTNSGNIIHQNVVYKIEYHKCQPVDACAATAVMLSFRQVRQEFYTTNYVLVRIVQTKSEEL